MRILLLNDWALTFFEQDGCKETLQEEHSGRRMQNVMWRRNELVEEKHEGDYCVRQYVSLRGPELGMDERNRKMTSET